VADELKSRKQHCDTSLNEQMRSMGLLVGRQRPRDADDLQGGRGPHAPGTHAEQLRAAIATHVVRKLDPEQPHSLRNGEGYRQPLPHAVCFT
jgi:hypothetical protein